MEDKLGISEWDLKAWIGTLGSVPVERLAHEDLSESYEMTVAHVFKLENKKYALITEEGCSCYESSQAEIELFPTKAAALEAFEKWKKAKTSPV